MIDYNYSEFAKGGAVHFWTPDQDLQVVVEALPPNAQRTIRWAGYYAVDGTLGMSNSYNDVYRHSSGRHYDLLRDGIDVVMSNHLWRCLQNGVDTKKLIKGDELLPELVATAATIRDVAAAVVHHDERSLRPYQQSIMSTARGIVEPWAILAGRQETEILKESLREYREAVIIPFVTSQVQGR